MNDGNNCKDNANGNRSSTHSAPSAKRKYKRKQRVQAAQRPQGQGNGHRHGRTDGATNLGKEINDLLTQMYNGNFNDCNTGIDSFKIAMK